MEMVDLATINRLLNVSHDYQLFTNKYLTNGSSLTITTFHPSLHNYPRMLTLLLIPRSLKHFRIINTLDSRACDTLIGFIPSIISRNSCTLTSIDLSFDGVEWNNDDHKNEMNALYYSISMCSLLTTLKLDGLLLDDDKDQAMTHRLGKGCRRLQIIPWMKHEQDDKVVLRTLSILGNIHLYISMR
jgi:hypothetical protein